MTPAEGIAKLGFRRWYERELIEGHAYLVTSVLGMIAVATCLEQIEWHGPVRQLVFVLSMIVAGSALCLGSLKRYGFLLARAECMGSQSSCAQCSTYGVLKVTAAGQDEERVGVLRGADNPWIRVRCKKCGHEWRIDNQ